MQQLMPVDRFQILQATLKLRWIPIGLLPGPVLLVKHVPHMRRMCRQRFVLHLLVFIGMTWGVFCHYVCTPLC